jgi:hypothetical protein
MQEWTCYIISVPSGGLVTNHNRNQCITSTLGWRRFTVNTLHSLFHHRPYFHILPYDSPVTDCYSLWLTCAYRWPSVLPLPELVLYPSTASHWPSPLHRLELAFYLPPDSWANSAITLATKSSLSWFLALSLLTMIYLTLSIINIIKVQIYHQINCT